MRPRARTDRAGDRCGSEASASTTIGTHLYNIKQKLAVANQSELTLIAIRHGLIQA